MQFLFAIVLGYLSGCFYPLSFFPKSVETIASILPTKVALDYLNKSLLSQQKIEELVVKYISRQIENGDYFYKTCKIGAK